MGTWYLLKNMKKLKILFHSDYCLINTGFAKHAKNILTYLYNTNKYDIVTYNCGIPADHPTLLRTPWKSLGTMPTDQEITNILNQHPPDHKEGILQQLGYGVYFIDKVIMEEKPDVYIGVQDIWGVDFTVQKHWFDKINTVIWTTLDSLPFLPSTLSITPKIKNFWIWSDFATKEMHRIGNKHVKTVHGSVDTKNFYKLEKVKKELLRKKFNIDQDTYIAGFVARNQLRKQFPQLLEGFSIFQKNNPKIKSKLLFVTHWAENQGWDLERYIELNKLKKEDILTAYICKNCKEYEIKPYTGQDVSCRFCGDQKSQVTTNPSIGVTEDQLNEIYNLMDVYVHPISSGGLELPIYEAKCVELITLVTNYSCGEDACVEEAQSIPLTYEKYYEHKTNFIKSTTHSFDIAKKLLKVYEMDSNKKREMGKKARDWTISNFSIEKIGKELENYLDSLTPLNFSFEKQENKIERFPDAKMEDILLIDSDDFFINECYKRILNVEPDEAGKKHWLNFLNT